IVEAKASPRRAPLREPARAYIRIRDDFKRKSGIQSASEQANNLRNLIINNEKTPLYDKKGNLLYTINRCDYDNIYCICVTKDDFGMLATNLTLMLEKKEDEPYPWVICI
ncbi:TPA: NERD domain-containing protein, partial [Salmonella enterica]|nr:NERD domain-containing protein [Salmonella enterica]